MLLSGCDSTPNSESSTDKNKILLQGKTMGTKYHVAIVHNKEAELNANAIKSKIDALLEELNQQVSTYIPDSQISQFNRSNSTEWIKVDKDFFSIVETAQNVSITSNGALDISIFPLVDIWGFGARKRDDIPNASQIREALNQTGYESLILNSAQQSLKKKHKQLHIDLSAIAKGFAVDKISDLLKEEGYSNHLVEIGGELKANGLNQSDKKWRIAIEQPDSSNTLSQQGIEISNRAVATSGDYRNYFVEKGIRRSHIIDPKTGYPIKHKLASVTVLHDSTMLADAYATALLVMGENKGKVFVEENNLDALMIIRNDNNFEFWSSTDFFR